MRRFAIVGHRAMSKGKLPLNDLAGGAGRMDVLVRAMMAALLTSHGLRKGYRNYPSSGWRPWTSKKDTF